MAFKRKTKRGSSGNRTTTTFHNDGTGRTRSYSSSSTGKQKTGSGGARYTTTIHSDGRTTKTITRHGANGFISKSSKTTGGSKKPKKIKAKLSTPKYKSTKIRNVFSRRRSSSGRSRSSSSRGRSASPQEVMATLVLIGGIGVLYLIVAYWQYILAAIGVSILATIIYFLSKNK
jgi:cobalamin biosynthesis Mg chelatase CobN